MWLCCQEEGPGAVRVPAEGRAGHHIRAALAHHLVRPRAARLRGRGAPVRLLLGPAAAHAHLSGRSHCPVQEGGHSYVRWVSIPSPTHQTILQKERGYFEEVLRDPELFVVYPYLTLKV
jgi:hypothetical protein